MKYLNTHQALFILRNCLSLPKMMHLLRSSPCYRFQEKLNEFDCMIKNSAENIINVNFNENAWIQSTLPIRPGGIGLILASDIASSAFISSIYATNNLRSLS